MEYRDLLNTLLPKSARWNLIGIQLGLSQDELDIIRANSIDVRECLERVLQKWFNSSPNPTWKDVITALKTPALDELKLAQEIEEKLVIPMDSEPDDSVSAEIFRKNLTKIKGSFATLVMRVTKRLERKEIDMKGFRMYIINLFPPGDIISNASGVTDIFEIISRHQLWDYTHYAPIEEISEKFGGDDPELTEWIKDYRLKLAGFYATSKIVDYITVLKSEEEIAEPEESLRQDLARYDKHYCKKLTIKLKARITDNCLDYIDQLWRSIAEYFSLPSLSVLLDSIHEGCIEVTWCVPTPLAFQIQTNIPDSTEFFQHQEVIQVVLDDEILYDEVGMNEKLLNACENGEVDEVLALLTYGVDVDTANPKDGMTPLLVAARNGNMELVHVLLDYRATIDKPEMEGNTPLMVATVNGYFDIVQLLLEYNADVNAIMKDGWTPLKYACRKCNVNIVKLLIEHGADVNIWSEGHQCFRWTPLMFAANNGHIEISMILLEHGSAVDLPQEVDFGTTPLMRASLKGRVEMVRVLLEYGAAVDKQDDDGVTPLMLASENGHLEVVHILLEYNADVTKTLFQQKWTALLEATYRGHYDIAKVLLLHNASPNTHGKNSWSPLMFVTDMPNENLLFVQLLLDAGAFINYEDKDGWSPLNLSCVNGHTNVVKLLIERGADVNMWSEDKKGTKWTPLMVAAIEGHLNLCRILLEHGALMELPGKVGTTPLVLASSKGKLEVVNLLLESGANVSTQNEEDGMTAIYSACLGGHLDIVKVLHAHGVTTDVSTQNGSTLLIAACTGGHLDVVQYLLEQKLQVNIQSKSGWSPLTCACDGGHSAIVTQLLAHGADTELYTHESGLSPLIIAARIGHYEIVKQLLLANAQVDHTEETAGWSAMHVAVIGGHPKIVKLLMEHGVNLSLTSKSRMTAYDLASLQGHREICDEMECHGYKPQTPPTEHMGLQVELSDRQIQQKFLNMENISTFREVMQDRDRNIDIPKIGSNNPTLRYWEPETW